MRCYVKSEPTKPLPNFKNSITGTNFSDLETKAYFFNRIGRQQPQLKTQKSQGFGLARTLFQPRLFIPLANLSPPN
jgi:hypothetical protein